MQINLPFSANDMLYLKDPPGQVHFSTSTKKPIYSIGTYTTDIFICIKSEHVQAIQFPDVTLQPEG
jgi:hypothetical protein